MRAWENFLTEMEQELGPEVVAKWLRPLKVVRFDACNLYLEAKDSFPATWFEEHMRSRVNTQLVNNNNKKIRVHLLIAQQQELDSKKKRKKGAPSSLTTVFHPEFDEVDSEITFETYLSTQRNLLAYKLLQDLPDQHPPSFNPIYLFGRAGSGKTHLLMATANLLRAHHKQAAYVRADTFTEHVVKAIRTGEMQTFRKAYRHVDALLIDDIEVFSRKGATQEEFFHTFNTLHIEGKQIILSANCPPQELKHVEPRLISRFEWGISVPLHMLDKEGMEKTLELRASRLQFSLSPDVSAFLLKTFTNTKTLIRALEALVLRSHMSRGLNHQLGHSLEAVQRALTDLINEEEKSVITPAKIIKSVAEFHGIRIEDILCKSQARESVLPRQIAMHLCRKELNLPFMKIGDIFSRDHSTVMTSVKQVQKGLDTKNGEVSDSVKGVLRLLHNR